MSKQIELLPLKHQWIHTTTIAIFRFGFVFSLLGRFIDNFIAITTWPLRFCINFALNQFRKEVDTKDLSTFYPNYRTAGIGTKAESRRQCGPFTGLFGVIGCFIGLLVGGIWGYCRASYNHYRIHRRKVGYVAVNVNALDTAKKITNATEQFVESIPWAKANDQHLRWRKAIEDTQKNSKRDGAGVMSRKEQEELVEFGEHQTVNKSLYGFVKRSFMLGIKAAVCCELAEVGKTHRPKGLERRL